MDGAQTEFSGTSVLVLGVGCLSAFQDKAELGSGERQEPDLDNPKTPKNMEAQNLLLPLEKQCQRDVPQVLNQQSVRGGTGGPCPD